MSNVRPLPPNLVCPEPVVSPEGYFTEEQSHLNVTRKDKFRLVMDVPNMLKPILKKENRFCHGGNMDRLQMSIWGFVVPDMKIDVITKPFAGQHLKFSGLARPAFTATTVNFTVDNRFDNYFILYKWLDIQNDESNSTFDGKQMDPDSHGHLCDYATTFTVIALDEYEKPTAKWDYIGAFPVTLGGINASYRDPAELETTFSFEFSQVHMSLL